MDIILYNIVVGFCSLFIGYLFGSIPTGVIIGKVCFHRDPRLEGSKNSGGTNVGRVFGKKVGIIVIIIDMVKCIIPLVSVWAIITFSPFKDLLASEAWNNFHNFYIFLAPLGAAIGHCWPIFAGFKGGKAVATFCGFIIATCWLGFIVGLLTFFGVLKLKKYVSLSSMCTAITASLVSWLLFILKICVPSFSVDIFMIGCGSFVICGWEFAVVTTLIAFILIVRHKANIARLINHQERKISWMK